MLFKNKYQKNKLQKNRLLTNSLVTRSLQKSIPQQNMSQQNLLLKSSPRKSSLQKKSISIVFILMFLLSLVGQYVPESVTLPLPAGLRAGIPAALAAGDAPDYITDQPPDASPTYASITEMASAEGAIKCGDVNADGQITVADAIIVLQHLVGLTTLPESRLTPAMVNDGETLNIRDAILILQKVAGLIDSFPACTDPTDEPDTMPAEPTENGPDDKTIPDETSQDENPFLKPYNTPFGLPPFEEIKPAHFIPALQAGIRDGEETIEAIIANPAPPTFENTIIPYEYSGTLITQVNLVFFNYLYTISNDDLNEIAGQFNDLLTEYNDNIVLNSDLFERIKGVYTRKDELELTEEEAILLEKTFQKFYQNGAALPEEKQERFREINQSLSQLSMRFRQNVLSDVDEFKLFVESEEELKGLPQDIIDAAAAEAAAADRVGSWLFTLRDPIVLPVLTYGENRELRKTMAEAYARRGNNDNANNNRDIINQLVALRLEKSQLLGHPNYAAYVLQNRMAGSHEAVEAFLNQLWEAVLPVATEEVELLQQMVYQDGHDFELAHWDRYYYSEKVRREQYNLDETELREYFSLDNVLTGLFTIVEKLWGLQFVRNDSLPRYHPDITTWEVMEADGTRLGILYLDLLARPGKKSGAWMYTFQVQHITQQGEPVQPVVLVACNFSAPVGERPTLLTLNEVNILFHELGHALHGLLSDVCFPSSSLFGLPVDFMELPSQLLENWARKPEVLKMFGRHYDRGDTIPDEMLEKIRITAKFNQGIFVLRQLSFAKLDLEYHILTEYEPFEPAHFEQRVHELLRMPDGISLQHISSSFQHIFSGGYSASYYSYLWSGLLDADAFEAFLEAGDIFDGETALRFRTEILERGSTRDAMEMYLAFRGREPEIEAYLRQKGLTED